MNKLYCAEKTWSETFFSEENKVFHKIFEPSPESKEKGRRGKTNTKLFRGGNVLPSFPYLSVFHPFPLIERENRERSFNFAFDQHLDLDEQLSLGRGVAPPDNARRSMRFHAAFTERELNFKGNSFETSMPAKRAPCLGKTTFVPNTLASAYLSAHLGEALLHPRHPRKGGGEGLKGEEDPSPLRWIFQNQMLSRGRGRRKDPRKRQQRLGKGLERLRGMPS